MKTEQELMDERQNLLDDCAELQAEIHRKMERIQTIEWVLKGGDIINNVDIGLTFYCVQRIKQLSKEKGISLEEASKLVKKDFVAFLEATKKLETKQ